MQIEQRKQSVILTERDYFVLKGLYDFVVMSFPQISNMHFAGKAKPTVINRLAKLEMAGLISKYKVPRLLVPGATGVISVVYQISRLGIKALQNYWPDLEFWPEPASLRPYSIDHDLTLNDVMTAIKRQNPDIQILHGEHFLRKAHGNSLKPDAVLLLPGSSQSVALELELTAKSEKRYRELILKYRLSKDFGRVLYVTGHMQIAAKIKSILGASDISNRFQFVQLKDLLDANAGLINFNLQAQGLERKGGCV